MFDELEQFVADDVPFLQGRARPSASTRLRELMASVEASPSEKFRRLLEAYQIEMEYGRTMSSYTANARPTAARPRFVRLGRVSLMYRTVEGGETGYWDNEQQGSGSRTRTMRRADRGSAEHRQRGASAPDLITVPVPAPQGGRS